MSNSDSEDDFVAWWERTFAARENELESFFGRSHPSGAAEGDVLAFDRCGSGEHEILIPSGCAHVCPPNPAPRDQELKRLNWLYVTVGLSQPSDPDERPWDDESRGRKLSGRGVEFAAITSEPGDRLATFLAEIMGYHAARSRLYTGHRVAGGFYEPERGTVSWFLGVPERDGITPFGATRAFLFWPLLGAPRWFTTDTGNFEILCATNISAPEWDYARQTSSAHLQLLLCQTGVGQQMSCDRPCTFEDSNNRREAEKLRTLSRDKASAELRSLRSLPWL
jgi:hypothetical protein